MMRSPNDKDCLIIKNSDTIAQVVIKNTELKENTSIISLESGNGMLWKMVQRRSRQLQQDLHKKVLVTSFLLFKWLVWELFHRIRQEIDSNLCIVSQRKNGIEFLQDQI